MYKRYTPKEVAFIKKKIAGRSVAEMTALFNRHFGAQVTTAQIKSFMANHKLRNGIDARFLPGHTPHNKGKERWWVGGEATQFKAGHSPWNHRPVGSTRLNVEGYVEVKIAEPNKWKCKHAVIWEKKNGPIPKGCVVIFADSDKSNFKLRNLILVSRSELAVMNHCGLIYENGEFTKTGKLIADVKIRISTRIKGSRQRAGKVIVKKGADNGKC